MSVEELFNKIKNGVIEGDAETVKSAAQELLKRGVPAKDILKPLMEGMDVISKKFDMAEIFLPHVMVAAEAMIAGLEVIKPELTKAGVSAILGKVVIGTVEGDIHEIGKTIVAYMLMGAGFDVVDLGRDVKIELFAEEAKKINADVVAVSALMSNTTPNQKLVVEALKEYGIYEKPTKVIVGGPCASEEWAESIGAYYAPDASAAIPVVKRMVGKA